MRTRMKYRKGYPWRFEMSGREGVYWLSDHRSEKGVVSLVQAVKSGGGMELQDLHGNALDVQPDCWGNLPEGVKISANPMNDEDAEHIKTMTCRPLIV